RLSWAIQPWLLRAASGCTPLNSAYPSSAGSLIQPDRSARMKTKLRFSPLPTKQVSRTFFHSALMTAVILLLALVGAKLLPPSSSSAKQNTQNGGKSCPNCGTRSNQIIYLPLIDLPEAQGSEIVFNSRSPQEMDVTPTFYKLDGTAIVGKPVRIQSSEIRYVDLKKLIPGPYRNDQDWG